MRNLKTGDILKREADRTEIKVVHVVGKVIGHRFQEGAVMWNTQQDLENQGFK